MTASGSLSMTINRTRAAPSGWRRILFPIAQRGWQDAEAGCECILAHFEFGPNCPHVEVGRNMHPVGFRIGFAFGDRLGR